ncbi:hypothetical protein P9112_001838 [Eukaryota sp. TZLM1-RC]
MAQSSIQPFQVQLCNSVSSDFLDPLRCPLKVKPIPNPRQGFNLGCAIRSFLDSFVRKVYDINPLWNFFKDSLSVSQSNPSLTRPASTVSSKCKRFEKMFLDGKVSGAMAFLSSQSLAPQNSETISTLLKQHPFEDPIDFASPVDSFNYWKSNPFSETEVSRSLSSRPYGRAAGPSLLTFDHLKSASKAVGTIIPSLTQLFNLIMLNPQGFPPELSASRLIPLSKKNNGVKPIAIGENENCAKEFLGSFQFGIGTYDGAISAALAVDLFMNLSIDNMAVICDFKNAFNSVKRNAILESLKTSPVLAEVSPLFEFLYSKHSNLVLDTDSIPSCSGVKQGDPIGPFLFCVALHPLFEKLKSRFPDLKVVAYMDDVSLIGNASLVHEALIYFGKLALNIGLELNASKCQVLGRSFHSIVLNDEEISFVDYQNVCFELLRSFIGNESAISRSLHKENESASAKLDEIQALPLCFSSKVNHLIRSIPPDLTTPEIKFFLSRRTNFLVDLLSVKNIKDIPLHCFRSHSHGGVGLTRSSILTNAAFLGGIKNFLFELSVRFPNSWIDLVTNSNSSAALFVTIFLDNCPDKLWFSMFASTVDGASVEVKDLSNFLRTVPQLQKKLINALEAESLEEQISLANNSGDSSFATFLSSLCDKGSFINSASCLITQVPRRFGLLLSNSQFLTIMRLRLNLPPPQCLTNIRCKCGAVASYTHVLSCRKFTQKRSIIHNAVRDCIYDLLKSAHHPVRLEPVFDEMQLAQSQKTGDIQCAWRSGQELIIDCTTVSP